MLANPSPSTVEGVTLSSVTVPSFSDPAGLDSVSSDTATIDWGDGGTDPGVVFASGNTVYVTGSHSYARSGNYQVSTSLQSGGGSSASATAQVSVADAALTAGGQTLGATEGQSANLTVATFADPNPNALNGDFQVSINWGDGTTDAADAVTGSPASFSVVSSHTYTHFGSYTVSTTVTDSGGATATATSRVTVADAGPTSVTVAASNGSVSTSQTFTWNVNPRVTLTALADRGNVEGDIVALQTTASDTAGAVLTYSADGLPPGLSINTATGLIAGTITAGAASGGPYTVTVTASDGGGYSSSGVFTWTVTATANTPPTLTNPGTQSNTAGDAVVLPLAASDLPGDALTFSAGTLPDGLTIDPYSGVISGTLAPDAASVTPYAVTVTADNGVGGTTSQTFTWIVNDAPLSMQATPVAATEGVDTGSVTVATFTTPDLGSQASDFTATVTWGDGTSDTGTVSGGNGTFSVTDDHLYAEAGAFPVSVQVSDNSGGSATASATATVADAALTLTGGFQAGAVAGQSVMFTLATLNDANANAAATDYHLSIDWGDGSGTTGGYIATEGGGFFALTSPHSYTLDGTYTVTLQVTDADGATATTSSTVAVGVLYAGAPAVLSVYGFSDVNSSAPASDFTAQIQWGDGSSSVGTVSGGGGIYGVSGSHTYAADSFSQPGGVYQVSVTVQDVDGSTLSRNTSVAVERPALALTAVNTVVVPDSLIVTNAEVAAFTEADTLDSSAEFSATISWGDGSSSNGTLTGSGGLFHVLGSHTYATYGGYAIQVTVLQHWDTLLVAADKVIGRAVVLETGRPLEGPTVVPGLSRCAYKVQIREGGKLDGVKWDIESDNNAAKQLESRIYGIYNILGWNFGYELQVEVEFANKPATVRFRLFYTFNGVAKVADFPEVYVVQVKVTAPPPPRAYALNVPQFMIDK